MFISGFLAAMILGFFLWISWFLLKKCQRIKEKGEGYISSKLKAGIIISGKVGARNEIDTFQDSSSGLKYGKVYVHVEKYGPGQKLCTYDALVPDELFDYIKPNSTYRFYVQENQTLLYRKEDNPIIKS